MGRKITSKDSKDMLHVYHNFMYTGDKKVRDQNLLHSMIVGNEFSPLVCENVISLWTVVHRTVKEQKDMVIEQGVVPFD